MRILFVCTGNICRSPFAERLTKRLVEDVGWTDVHVASAGTHALEGHGCPVDARKAALDMGVDLAPHIARQVDQGMLDQVDIVLVMAEEHRRMLGEIYASLPAERIQALVDFAPGPNRLPYIPDPFGSELWAYRASYRLIDACVRGFLDELSHQRHRSG